MELGRFRSRFVTTSLKSQSVPHKLQYETKHRGDQSSTTVTFLTIPVDECISYSNPVFFVLYLLLFLVVLDIAMFVIFHAHSCQVRWAEGGARATLICWPRASNRRHPRERWAKVPDKESTLLQ